MNTLEVIAMLWILAFLLLGAVLVVLNRGVAERNDRWDMDSVEYQKELALRAAMRSKPC